MLWRTAVDLLMWAWLDRRIVAIASNFCDGAASTSRKKLSWSFCTPQAL